MVTPFESTIACEQMLVHKYMYLYLCIQVSATKHQQKFTYTKRIDELIFLEYFHWFLNPPQ